MKKVFSTKKGKAVFSVVIAAAVACGTVTGVTVHNNNVRQAQLQEVEEAREQQAEIDADSAKEVDSLIDAIGEVTLDSENAITKAEDGYNKLNDNAKGFVLKYDTLKEARSTYDTLVAARDNADTTSGAGVAENADTVTDESPLETPKVEDTAKKQTESNRTTTTKKKASSSSTATAQTTPDVTVAQTAPAETVTPATPAPSTPSTPSTPATDTQSQPATPTAPADTAGTDLSQYEYGMSNATVTDNGDGTVTSTGNFANGGPAVITVTTDTNTGEVTREINVNGMISYGD